MMKQLAEQQLKEAWDLLEGRYSCRSFRDEPISDELLEKLLAIGVRAASGGNLQPCTIMAVRDKENNRKLMEAAGGQPFVASAAVNLVFFLDWRRLSVYVKHCKASFTLHKNLEFLMIALMDVICAAQSIESAATLAGIHSCYVGNIFGENTFFSEHFSMPEDKVFPVVMLSMGYPKTAQKNSSPRLAREIVTGYEKYPEADDETLIRAFSEKYRDMSCRLPKNQPFRKEMLQELAKSLSVDYTEEEVSQVLREIEESGSMNEMQRKLTFQYPAHEAELFTAGAVESLHQAGIMEKMEIKE